MKNFYRFPLLFFVLCSLFFVLCVSCASPHDTGDGPNPPIDYTEWPSIRPKNIIILIGDGMGPVHEDAGRASKGEPLVWDSFDYHAKVYTGSLTTLSSGSPTDSAASATAMATGKKTNNGIIGMNASYNAIDNIMKYAQDKGKLTGVLTSDSLNGATPAGFSAHVQNRNLSTDIVLSQAASGIDLLMGAGLAVPAYSENIGAFTGRRYSYVRGDVTALSQAGGRIIALFEVVRLHPAYMSATLQEMTAFALERLGRSGNGFVLMIEGAKIDWMTTVSSMLEEFEAFEECARIVYDWAKGNGETLIIVTADHETGGMYFADGEYRYTYTNGAHTTTDVNCHIYWPHGYSPFAPYLEDGRIDNTDIFRIMYSAIQ